MRSNKTAILVILIIVLIVSIIIYLFFQQIQKYRGQVAEKEKENTGSGQEIIFKMKQRCREEGERLYQQLKDENKEAILLRPEYTYNKKLNTCLYAGGIVRKGYFERWVLDVFSNEELVLFINLSNEKKERNNNLPQMCFFHRGI